MRYRAFFLAFIFTIICFNFSYGIADSSLKADSTKILKIYKYNIKEEIAPPVWRKTEKAFREAKEMEAGLILIHLNTFGGLLDAADLIRTKILNSEIPVYVFIDNNAASAGALISIACDSIYMRTGANIGAATVVNQTGEAMPDKYQSYMRSMMRSTAQAKGRDPDIAQAMVDPRISIEGVIDSTKVLTFTTEEAIKHGFCEGEAQSIDDVIKKAGHKKYIIIEQKLTAMDGFIGFLINPLISGFLIMIIIGGIYFELQSPGVGFPIAASILAAILYFFPLYYEGLAANWEIIIFIVGLILVGVEIFAIPGFGVAGISGILLIVVGLTLSMVDNIGFDFTYVPIKGFAVSFFTVVFAMLISLILSYFLSKLLFTRRTIFGTLALDATQEASQGFISSANILKTLIGQIGIANTILRPVGKIEIGNEIYDATAETGYIEKGDKIKVIKHETAQLFVRKIK